VNTSVSRQSPPDSALIIQCRVVHALVMRDVKSRYGGRRLGFLWALIEPLMMIGVFIGIFHLMGRSTQGGIPAPLFFVAAFTPFFMFRDIFSNVMMCIKGSNPLLMFPQVARTDIILSSVIVDILVSLAVFFLLLLGCVILGFEFTIDRPLEILFSLALLIGLGVGLGLVLGALTIRYEFVSSVSQAFLGRPLFLTSGLFFTADVIPAQARDYLLLNPVLQGIEAVRSAMFTQFESRYVDYTYVFLFAVVMIAFGLMLMNFFERQRH
jgi:capsular polysaccharide transport system permease protein